MESLDNGQGGLDLPPVLDLVAAPRLLEAFLTRRGQNLTVDGAAVQRLGGQCLQVLMAARAAWAADDRDLALENLSEEFAAGLDMLGLAPAALNHLSHTSKDLAA